MQFCWQDLEDLKCVHESEKEHGLQKSGTKQPQNGFTNAEIVIGFLPFQKYAEWELFPTSKFEVHDQDKLWSIFANTRWNNSLVFC